MKRTYSDAEMLELSRTLVEWQATVRAQQSMMARVRRLMQVDEDDAIDVLNANETVHDVRERYGLEVFNAF